MDSTLACKPKYPLLLALIYTESSSPVSSENSCLQHIISGDQSVHCTLCWYTVAELEMNCRGGYFQHSQGHNGGARNEPVEAQFFSVCRDAVLSATSVRLGELYTKWAFKTLILHMPMWFHLNKGGHGPLLSTCSSASGPVVRQQCCNPWWPVLTSLLGTSFYK